MAALADRLDGRMQLRIEILLGDILLVARKGHIHDDIIGQALERVAERHDTGRGAVRLQAGAQLGDHSRNTGLDGQNPLTGEKRLEGAAAETMQLVGHGAEGGIGVVELVDERGGLVPAAVLGVEQIVAGRIIDVQLVGADPHHGSVPPVQSPELEQELPAPAGEDVEVGFIVDC